MVASSAQVWFVPETSFFSKHLPFCLGLRGLVRLSTTCEIWGSTIFEFVETLLAAVGKIAPGVSNYEPPYTVPLDTIRP